MKKLAALQAISLAGLFGEKQNPYFKNDNSTKPTLPTFEVNGMFIQAVNEQAAKDKYDKIISKRNRKQKQ